MDGMMDLTSDDDLEITGVVKKQLDTDDYIQSQLPPNRQ